MEIASVGANYNNNQVKSETEKQASTTEQQEVNTIKTNEVVTDSFTKSAAADAISKQAENTQLKTVQDANGASETEQQSTPINTSPNPTLAAGKMPPSKPASSTSISTDRTDTNAISDVGTDTADNIATLTSVSEYTAAELALYDLNGDGEIDTAEAAKMKAVQAREASQEASQEGLSIEQIEAKEAYENAKIQLLSSEEESIIDEQI